MELKDRFKFEQLSALLEGRLEHMGPGAVFLGVRSMMQEFGVSQATAYKAVEILKNKGLLESNDKGRLIVTTPDTATRRSLRVAIITTDSESPYLNAIVKSVVGLSHEQKMSFTVCPTHEVMGDISNLKGLYDGFLVVPGLLPIEPHTVARWVAAEVPVVVFDRRIADLQVDCVGSNNYLAGLLAARHLIQQGHKKMAVLVHQPSLRVRADGFMDEAALAEGISIEVLASPVPVVGADRLCVWMESELRKLSGVTALFALTHTASLALLRTLYSMSWRVPDEVSVIGFDNLHSSGLSCPPMTTIDQEIGQMARAACELLRRRFLAGRKGQAEQVTIRPTLVVRSSTAPQGSSGAAS